MKKLLYLFIFSLLTAGYSCSKIELPTENSQQQGNNDNKEDENGTGDKEGETENPNNNSGENVILNVSAALSAETGSEVYVLGYIVGYIKSNSYVFGIPTEESNANMLLADSPDETMASKTLAVKLGSKSSAERLELNLFDHPEYYKMKIKIFGTLATYYRKNGITAVFGYEFFDDEDDNGNENNDNGNDDNKNGNDDNGNGNDDNGNSDKDEEDNRVTTPNISYDQQVIENGR